MSETKAVNATKEEIQCILAHHCYSIGGMDDIEAKMERINYFYKRLKAFDADVKVEELTGTKPPIDTTANANAANNGGWPNG